MLIEWEMATMKWHQRLPIGRICEGAQRTVFPKLGRQLQNKNGQRLKTQAVVREVGEQRQIEQKADILSPQHTGAKKQFSHANFPSAP